MVVLVNSGGNQMEPGDSLFCPNCETPNAYEELCYKCIEHEQDQIEVISN